MTDHDPVLREALRAALATQHDAAFAARVMARLDGAPAWWEVLGVWARPGLAAAAMLIALAGLWLGTHLGPMTATIDETVAAATPGTMAALLAADRPPTVDVVLAVSRPR